jgi:hypothetical protein
MCFWFFKANCSDTIDDVGGSKTQYKQEFVKFKFDHKECFFSFQRGITVAIEMESDLHIH